MTSKRKAQTPIMGSEFDKTEELTKDDTEQWFADDLDYPAMQTMTNLVGTVALWGV